MIRTILFPLSRGSAVLASDLEKHAADGYLPQMGVHLQTTDGAGAVLFVLIQCADPKATAEIVPTTEIPIAARSVEVPGNGGSHA